MRKVLKQPSPKKSSNKTPTKEFVNCYFDGEVKKGNDKGIAQADNLNVGIASVTVPHQGAVLHQQQSQAGARGGGLHGRGPAPRVLPSCPSRVGGGALGSYRITDTERLSSTVNDFKRYLASTAACHFNVHTTKWNEEQQFPDENEREIEYIHRWTNTYRKSIIAKFYQLEEYFKERGCPPLTLLTLTTYQDGDYSVSMTGGITTIEEGFNILKKGWKWLSMWIRKHHPELEYITIMEPHKTGYPHLHVILFGTLPETSQKTIKSLWSEKYKAGSYDNGADFTISDPKEGIKSIRNYLIKYIAKTLKDGKTGSKYNITEGWTKGELLFNAVMWKNKYRLWGASATLSKVMAQKPAVGRSSQICDYTELIDENGESHVTYKREGYEIKEETIMTQNTPETELTEDEYEEKWFREANGEEYIRHDKIFGSARSHK